jgi:hypothetical protein
MKTIFSIILFLFVSTFSFGQGKETKKEWIQSFKHAVYYYGFLNGLENRELAKEIIKVDNSGYNPPFQVLHDKAINKAGNYLVGLVRKDFKDRDGRVGEGAGGKRIMLICLNFYTSAVLDSIANSEYNKWINDPHRNKRIKEAAIAY